MVWKDNECLLLFLYVSVQLPLLFLFYTTSIILLSYCFPKLREQSLVHLKSHVELHAELTGYLLSTKLL